MPARDIVVIGGSAGGVTAVTELVRALPADVPAAFFVALHAASDSNGILPRILARAGRLPVALARDGDEVRPGRILLAPPNHHLVLEGGAVRLRGGPRVNRFRPSIDVLFRSAATAYGARVAAVILSGMLDDGAHGLLTVKQNGGVALVQDTAEAQFTSMPLSALDLVPVDHLLRVADLAAVLDGLARNGRAARVRPRERRPEQRPARRARPPRRPDRDEAGDDGRWLADARRSLYACPDCGGALLESDGDGVLRYRCRIGHGYTADSLVSSQDDRLEDALWTAVRALEEGAATKRRMASRIGARGAARIAAEYDERAAASLAHAATIREILDQRLEQAERAPARATAKRAAAPAGRRRRSASGAARRR